MDQEEIVLANILLDIFAVILALIPITYLANSERYKRRINLFFMGAAISNIAMIIGDLADWMLQSPHEPWQKAVLMAFTVLYYSASAFILYFFARYLIAYIKLEGKAKLRCLIAVTVLCALQVFFALLSPFTGAVFYVTDNGYQRGPMFFVSQLIPLLCYMLFATLLVISWSSLKRRDIFFFLLYIIVPLASGTVQMLFRGIAIVNIGVSLALLFTLVNIQFEHEIAMKEQEQELASQRIDIMLSQIQPHFLYNSLGTIYQLCETEPETAKKAIKRFSDFLRGNMDSLKNREPIPFEQELNHVMNYLYLEQQRFDDKLQVIYRIKVTNFRIPALTLQPLVENAVQHGVLNRRNGGTVTIRTEENDDCTLVTVSDNGVGMDKARQIPSTGEHSHIGIENVRSRLKESVGGRLEITSSGQGTTAEIRIPWNGDDGI